MSQRKRGGLDYTPRAFPGARKPDGPAPGLEDELVKMGLAEPQTKEKVRVDVSPGVKAGATPGTRKRGSLDYTPQAFPGARDPDGPAPGLEEKLIQMGLAEREEHRQPRPNVRHDARETQPPPPTQRQRTASPPPPRAPTPAPARRERDLPSEWSPPADDGPDLSARSTRVQSPPSPASGPRSRPVSATPQPVYVVPPPRDVDTDAIQGLLQPHEVRAAPSLPLVPPEPAPRPAPFLPPVPPEPAPRPAPVFADTLPPPVNASLGAAHKPAPRPPTRAARRIEQLKRQPDKEDRTRLSLRLVSSVDAKLNDLAHLRGLDRNTAVSVAIVQDWVGCFGMGSGNGR